MHKRVAADYAAPRVELVRDAGEEAPQSPDPVLDRKLAEPERRRLCDVAHVRATRRSLKTQGVDVLEHEAAVDVDHAIVVVPLDAVGVGHPDPRAVAQAVLRAENVEDGLSLPLARGYCLSTAGRNPVFLTGVVPG